MGDLPRERTDADETAVHVRGSGLLRADECEVQAGDSEEVWVHLHVLDDARCTH